MGYKKVSRGKHKAGPRQRRTMYDPELRIYQMDSVHKNDKHMNTQYHDDGQRIKKMEYRKEDLKYSARKPKRKQTINQHINQLNSRGMVSITDSPKPRWAGPKDPSRNEPHIKRLMVHHSKRIAPNLGSGMLINNDVDTAFPMRPYKQVRNPPSRWYPESGLQYLQTHFADKLRRMRGLRRMY